MTQFVLPYKAVLVLLVVFVELAQGLGKDAFSVTEDYGLRFNLAQKSTASLSFHSLSSILSGISWTSTWMTFLAASLGVVFFSLPTPKHAPLLKSTIQKETVLAKSAVVPVPIPKINLAAATITEQPSTSTDTEEQQQTQQSKTADPTESGYNIRPLSPRDYRRGYLELLEQSLQIPKVDEEFFMQRAKELAAIDNRVNLVIEHSGQIVGSATLTVEKKPLLIGERLLGNIDEVVVHKNHRRRRLGSFLLKKLTEEAKSRGCVKVCLDTDPRNEEFYNRAGFEGGRIHMTQRI